MATMETIIIFTDEISEEDYENATAYYKERLKELPATKIMTNMLGKKKLAYETQGRNYGYYTIFTYKTPKGALNKLETRLRNDECVLKFLTTSNVSDNYDPDPEDDLKSEQPDALDVLLGLADYKNKRRNKYETSKSKHIRNNEYKR